MRLIMAKAAAALTLFVALVVAPAGAFAQSATLAWDANTEPDVTGYRIHYGTQSGSYSRQVDVGNQTTYQVTGLDVSLDYYFAVQAYASSGLSSPLSNEVTLPAPVPPGTTTISSFGASVAYPLLPGKAVTWTAAARSTRGAVEYRFMRYSARSGWVVAQQYSAASSFTWVPTWEDLGAQNIQVWARTVGSPAAYEAWVGDAFTVNAAPMQITADVDFPTAPGQPVRWTATVAGAGSALEYRFVLLNQGTGVWSVVREYGTSNGTVWTPAAGNYVLQVWARRIGSSASYEVWGATPSLRVAGTPLEVSDLTVNRTAPFETGTALTWTARIKGGQAGPVQYQFVRWSERGGWQVVQPYSTSNSYTWTPGWDDEDRYALQVWVRNARSTAVYDAWRGTNYFTIARAGIHLTANSAFPVPPGASVVWTAEVPDPSVTMEYQFWVYNRGTGTWSNGRPYGTSSTFTWTPTTAGTYGIQVWARPVGSTLSYAVWRGTDSLTVASGPATLRSVSADVPLPAHMGTPITWTAVGSGGTAAPLQYKFYLYTEGTGWALLRDWSPDAALTWTPDAGHVGQNSLQVWIRSAGSTEQYEGWIGSGYFTIQP